MSAPHSRWRRRWRTLWQWPLALLILFEEWGWEPLQRAVARIGRWPGFRRVEGWVQRLPPYGALAVLALPSLLLLPVKLLALWAIAHGHGLLGVGIIVAAKLGGTALVARLFTLTQPALMQMPWFARLHGRWTAWKARLLATVRASAPWRLGRRLRRQTRVLGRRFWASLRGDRPNGRHAP